MWLVRYNSATLPSSAVSCSDRLKENAFLGGDANT